MANHRTLDLLPEIFQTDVNRQFLTATLDQLTQEPNFVRTQGYVGKRVGNNVNPQDNYVTEPTQTRVNYQLEPSVSFLKPGTQTARDTLTYPGLIDYLDQHNAEVDQPDRLFKSDYYTWDSFSDLDKFSNYSQYYWIPGGPDPVDISTSAVLVTDDFDVTRGTTGYELSGKSGVNPIITLVRGGSYTFDVNQLGNNFWIQAAPGTAGTMPATPNISSRNVLGVTNNGDDVGTITFNVPDRDAQDFYYNLTTVPAVDLITEDLRIVDINNVYVDQFLQQYPNGIDGITALDGRTIVFTNQMPDAETGGWQLTTQFDSTDQPGFPGSYDNLQYDQVNDITLQSERYSVWQIEYVYGDDGRAFMKLNSVRTISNLNKFSILYGEQYSSTQWYKNASGYFEIVPLLTAALDELYYQDANNSNLVGQIRLIDQDQEQVIDLDDIVGQTNYTSPNGVVFTNGLKVQFRSPTLPAQFENQTYYVEGVGTGPGGDKKVGYVNGRAYFGPSHVYLGRRMTGAAYDGSFQLYIYDTVEESLANPSAGAPENAPLPTDSIAGAADGFGIQLIPTTQLITPEPYTNNVSAPFDFAPFDTEAFDGTANAPTVPDYITVNRASQDKNAWCRSNRWFHIDVINYTAQLNKTAPVVDNNQRAKRPIIEFRPDLKLWNSGTLATTPVNIIDFSETDALSNVNGQIGYAIDGYEFLQGTLVIFAADLDAEVRNRIYRVDFIDPDGDPNSPDIINLVPITGGEILINQQIVSLNGITQQGLSYWYNGTQWVPAQNKTKVNQAPLFDVFDTNGNSFGDDAIYPSTTFAGSRLFGYAEGGTTTVDPVLGLSLQYLNLNNVGDIVFSNYLYTDTFLYVQANTSITLNVSEGFARQYINRVDFSSQLGWQKAITKNRARQVFTFINNGVPLQLGIPIELDTDVAPVQIYADGKFIETTKYTVSVTENNTTITFNTTLADGIDIEVLVFSTTPTTNGFYEVPLNLSNNAINGNSPTFTLGTIRSNYESIVENLKDLTGTVNGSNNTRDLGNIGRYSTKIVQHSSPLLLGSVFMRQKQYDVLESIEFNGQEYNKYKARLLDLAAKGNYINNTPTQVLDAVILEIALTRDETTPFYWSDMLPSGEDFTVINYTYSFTSTNTFDISKIYDFTTSNYDGLLVYLNGNILTVGYDYTVSTTSATIEILSTLSIGDVISIREYNSTVGSYVPNTPTKLGMYPAYKPKKYIDSSYVEPTEVIRGHDGSIIVAYGDFRDDVLLEFETRIFNNLKIHSDIPLTQYDVMPGKFRSTDYTQTEITGMLIPDFLSWVGQNRLNYTSQTYIANDAFTYNYNQSSDRIDGELLLGAWRGIYNYFYDTLTPNTTPWEMLGFSQEPSWWQNVYGPAPYTSGNMVMWEDLEAGYIADPANPRYNADFARPGLTRVIPAEDGGELKSPLTAVVGNYDSTSFQRSWAFGDNGPVENTWRTSSSYPFAIMKLLVRTKPAEFYSLFVDRDQYLYDAGLDQYLWDKRYRIEPGTVSPLYGSGTSRASYINWIIDYNQQRGINSSASLTEDLSNVDVRLAWRMAGFSDKKYLKVYTEQSTPGGLNTSLLLPDESYNLVLYKNQPFEEAIYSAVIVQTVEDGYSVTGYDTTNNFFEILDSRPFGKTQVLEAGGSVERVATEYTNKLVKVPYGFVFRSRNAVCDFLLSYGKNLERQGFTFNTVENGVIMDWTQMATEFLYWSNQGWATGSVINLNPVATRIEITKVGMVAENLLDSSDALIKNQNREAITAANMVVLRNGNTITVGARNPNTISFAKFRFTAYEHAMILDNRSIFADLLYDPITGARQNRILISGWRSGEWNGTLNVPGFILNQDNIKEWEPNVKYTKGEIVLFKNEYWAASEIVQPSEQFDYNLWLRSDYEDIQQGLLPNATNASNQLADAYDTKTTNLEQETDLFSYGLIGFRPRQYMSALNLDDVSQVNLYQQFLGTKGTLPSVELFTLAQLTKEEAQYDLFEIWAILSGSYGANANRSYFELLLEKDKLSSDPSVIQVIEPGQSSEANQTVDVENIYSSSYVITSPEILPTTSVIPDNSLPSAGYVNLEDIDYTEFDLTDDTALAGVIDNISIGTSIWVAKSNAYDWNVYVCEKTPGIVSQVADDLNGRSTVTFDTAHNLAVGDTLIIKEFNADINGSYTVRSVPTIRTVTIDYAFTGTQTSVTAQGIGLVLQSSRVKQPSDISNLPFANDLIAGAKVWVDDDSTGNWEVLQKTSPYVESSTLSPNTPVLYSRFGTTVSQGFTNLNAVVGAPGYNPNSLATAPGALYSFQRTPQDSLANGPIVDLVGVTGIAGLGNALDIGDRTWGVAGASRSNSGQGYALTFSSQPGDGVIDKRQLLVAPDQDFTPVEFGHAVTISQNERWMFISSPSVNNVYAYARQDVQSQTVSYVTNGTENTYNYSDSIVVDSSQPYQLVVVLENVVQTYGTDYTIDTNNVTLNVTPTAGQNLSILRRSDVRLDQLTRSAVSPDSTSGSGINALFTVNNSRGLYTVVLESGGESYSVSDTITINGTSVETRDTIAVDPTNNITITVTGVDDAGAITTFTSAGTGVSNNNTFDLTQYLVTATDIFAFTVTVDGILQRPHIDYDIEDSSSPYTLVFNTVPSAGANITVTSKTHWKYVDTLTVPGLSDNANFGYSVTTNNTGSEVMIGAPGIDDNAGKTYVFDRSFENIIIDDASQVKFNTVKDLETPGSVMVQLNGNFLTNTALNKNGNFEVNVSNPADQYVQLVAGQTTIGDTLTIHTNQFELIEVIESSNSQSGAKFGYALDLCLNDCSLYIGSPFASTSASLAQAGKVEFLQNQSRVFGTMNTTIANPVLTANDYIRLDGEFVKSTGTTVEQLVADIVAANLPNVTALLLPDVEFVGDSKTKTFSVGDIYSSAESYTTKVLLNNVELTENVDYTYNATDKTITIKVAPATGSTVKVVAGRIQFTVKNFAASTPGARMSVKPGTGTLYDDLGIDTYVNFQTIESPVPQVDANFGYSVYISDDTTTLVVGAPNGDMILPMTFDNSTTTFDANSATFSDAVVQSGAVYTYDILSSANSSISNPAQFVFGQSIIDTTVKPLDRFGESVNYTNTTLLVGASAADFDDSAIADYGKVMQYVNADNSRAWKVLRQQQPMVDISLLNNVYTYEVDDNKKTYFDFFDPLQGRLLGVVEQNVDYISAVDPAAYNTGNTNNYGMQWRQPYVGKIWWDTTRTRFIDPNQGDLTYASRRWGQLFPGSDVQLYQWIVSSVPPADYTGPGTPRNTSNYVVSNDINAQGVIVQEYYFWVTGVTEIDKTARKTLSIDTLTRYIESPLSSGISYLAPLAPSALSIYNGADYISSTDTLLYVEFDKQLNQDPIHQQFQLVVQDRPDSFLNDYLFNRLVDSFVGSNQLGAAVPDTTLNTGQRYGVETRPRQSMFVDRFAALKNYLTRANQVFAMHPLTETRSFNLLNSAEPEPSKSSGAWNKRVATLEELSYQNLNEVGVGYLYLVATDSSQNGLWTIYKVISINGVNSLTLERVQNYDTRNYWTYIDWYRAGYDPSTRITTTVQNRSDLESLTLPNGSTVKVTSNNNSNWEIFLLTNGVWERVGLENGTIAIDSSIWDYATARFGFDAEVFDTQYFDQIPSTETRKIIQAINTEILIDDLAIEKNRLLMLMFNYIMSEQETPSWLTKTSLVDVDHTIRKLLPFETYRTDNQDFVLQYINEVKPYHTQIREFNLKYEGSDAFQGDLTDFDLPAQWNSLQSRFISPVLDNTLSLSTTSSRPSTDPVWQQWPYNQWYQNYTLGIESVTVLNGGTGYLSPPEVTVTGTATRSATMTARINSAGQVVAIDVVDPGEGYTSTAIITITGTPGSGAVAVAQMGNSLVRALKTVIKYDRYQYQANFAAWKSGVAYNSGDRVRYANKVWQANDAIAGSDDFDPTLWTEIPADQLSGVDRTMGYYVPGVDEPGLDLSLLISGVDYPGVQVAGVSFTSNTGFDIGGYDMNVFDNITIGADGVPTYDTSILDAIYESSFTDSYLGTRTTDVTVDGGGFVDTYSSHAPEELVPGIGFDTLDLRVFTTPGADWVGDGHGFPSADRSYVFDGSTLLSFADLLDNIVGVELYNQTTGQRLALSTNYTVDWVNENIDVISGASENDVLILVASALGGSNQLYINSYVGSTIGDSVIVPIPNSLIDQIVVFANGVQNTDFTYAESSSGFTEITFGTAWTSTDQVVITLLGGNTDPGITSWSTPQTQYIVSDGSLSYTLTNSLSGTNRANLVVTRNGIRARPPEGAKYTGDGITTSFNLPDRGGYDMTLIADNDITVYLNNQLQVLGVDYFVDPSDLSSLRDVNFVTAPASGDDVLISVRTIAQYWVSGDTITFQPSQGLIPVAGDIIAVTSFNDTYEQDLVTQLFVGPTQSSQTVSQGFDTTLFDEGTSPDATGSFDFSVGVLIETNRFDVGFTITDPERLIVSLDGEFLWPGAGFTTSGTEVIISGPTISAAQSVAITSFTESVVSDAMEFRIFKDMRDNEIVYRMTKETTTQLSAALAADSDVIYVDDVTRLADPNPAIGVFGLITINGERITYRNKNTSNNTVSGLRRGTAGTGAAAHAVDSYVYDIGSGNKLYTRYQDSTKVENFLGDAATTTFTTSALSVPSDMLSAVQVFVGGELQTSGYTVTANDPIAVEFDLAPAEGYQVSIRVKSGTTWYSPGDGTPSNGVPLQYTTTEAARFLRGIS